MYIIRPIQMSDYQAYIDLAFMAKLGMLSLPKNRDQLKKNTEISLKAFSEPVHKRDNAFYLFVLENIETQEIGGVCGIYAQIGTEAPRYCYHLEKVEVKPFEDIPLIQQIRLLKPKAISHGPSEICSLYLAPSFRKEGLGKLLSLSRFLFIAHFPDLFENEIIAEMRGYVNRDNSNPFWENVGRKFLNISYPELIQMEHQGLSFIPHILPEYPLYLDLLPKEAQEVVGKVHENTQPALMILQNQGFQPCGLYDIFDAGPIVRAEKNHILSITESRNAVIGSTTQDLIDSPPYIISNNKLNFRACISPIKFITSEKVIVPFKTAQALDLTPGNSLRYIAASEP